MNTSTYERAGRHVARTKVLCAFAGEKKRIKEKEAYLHSCNHSGCVRHGTWCTEDWRQAEIRCPHYNTGGLRNE